MTDAQYKISEFFYLLRYSYSIYIYNVQKGLAVVNFLYRKIFFYTIHREVEKPVKMTFTRQNRREYYIQTTTSNDKRYF